MIDIVDAVVLFAGSETHQHYNMDYLNSYLVYPNRHDKLRVYYEAGEAIGLVTWAWLTPEKAKSFLLGEEDLTEADYIPEKEEGLQFWGVDFISPKGKARDIMRRIKQESKVRYGPVSVSFRRASNMTVEHKKRLI
jgi:hemolysin-activating ACP:hemolysin acyltransferase